MASPLVDEFVLNFDLNHLSVEEQTQPKDKKYAKIRKNMTWLKSRIISTDFVIQKYQSKKDDYDQSVKAHSVTKEEFKQACINYKDAIERCTMLENENKTMLVNQEVLKNRVVDIENKYDALVSHSNQLQALIKQLETERDALNVEKELDKFSSKDSKQEITVLQKEKDAILNDLLLLKDVILGKKKTSRRHLQLLKKYVKDVKCKGSKVLCTSEESDDDMDSYANISSHTKKELKNVPNISDKKLICSEEQNFIDNYSDGGVSVDTGRGSSRANSHDKYLNSPDYVVNLEALLRIPSKDVIKIDAANSPITVYPPISVATSPIVFDSPQLLFVDECDDYTDCYDATEYVIDDTPLSEEIDVLVEQEKLSDCASPVPDPTNFVDTETNSIENYQYVVLKESVDGTAEKSLFINPGEINEFDQDSVGEKQIPSCLCEKSDAQMPNSEKTLVDSCTSPLLMSPVLRKFIDIGINTDQLDKSVHRERGGEIELENSRSCENSACTRSASLLKIKDNVKCACNYVDQSTNTVNTNECENRIQKVCEKSTNTDSMENQLSEANKKTKNDIHCTEKNEKSRRSLLVNNKELPVFDEQISVRQNTVTNSTDILRSQEKVCLESNSSKSLHFESSNDVEVQNILSVMKLRHDLISPISKSPSDTDYLKLLPQMNHTLAKIWTTIANIYRMPSQLRNNDLDIDLNSTEIEDLREVPEAETSNRSQHEQLEIARTPNQHLEDEIIHATDKTFVETDIMSIEDSCSSLSVIPINEKSNHIISSETTSNTLMPNSRSDKIDETENENQCPQQQCTENSLGFKQASEINIISSNKKEEKNIVVEVINRDKEDLQQQRRPNFSSNEICENNINTTTFTGNTETCNLSEAPKAHTIIISGTKTKKKSKLEKFRDKLIPTCKIKKMSPIIKHSSKTNIKLQDSAATTSLSLSQKLAYENAVKVMAEIRSNQELQDKNKPVKTLTIDTDCESKPSKTKSAPGDSVELKILSTRSRTRTLSKLEEDSMVTANAEQNIKDIEKSPVKRQVRKRPADAEIDAVQNSPKRILRSSGVRHTIFNEKVLPVGRNDNVAEQPTDFEIDSNCKSYVKTVNHSNDSENRESTDNEQEDNLGNSNCSSQSQCIGDTISSDRTCEKNVIKKMKPVIELSKCLADNANVVSIIPGNVGYLDVNKNMDCAKNSAGSNNLMIEEENRITTLNKSNTENNSPMKSPVITQKNDKCMEQSMEVTEKTQNPNQTKDDESNISENTNYDQKSNRKEHNIPSISVKQTSQGKCSDLTNTKRNNSDSMGLKLPGEANICLKNPVVQLIPLKKDIIHSKHNIVCYSDLDLYTQGSVEDEMPNLSLSDTQNRKENILCAALDRYGVISVKYTAKKVPDAIMLKICHMIEESIPKIIASSKSEQKNKMDELVSSMQKFETKYLLAGLTKYLKEPTRKNELFNKIMNGSAPAMTKSEVILLYVVDSLNNSLPPGFINRLWNNMEHALFQLNRAPEFDVIESISHFYAVLCRYFRNKSRLRCFMLDAMYCLQFKAVPLIRQCLDVCPIVLPNAHERMAKTSLVTCLVYLLHFYKCQDKFNRAQDIRNILYRRYQYRFSEWNEAMILEIFRKAIMDLRGTHNDKKMLRVALIILCKRHGAKWCQSNIIQNMLLPIIEKKDVPEKIKQFCILMLGPLLKPFPADQKAQCEIIINQLLQMLKQTTSQDIKEAIYSSLIFMNKHDQERVVQAMLSWNPENVSPEFEEILNDYVMEKPLAVWKKLVTKQPSQCT